MNTTELRTALNFAELLRLRDSGYVMAPFFEIKAGVAAFGPNVVWEVSRDKENRLLHHVAMHPLASVDADEKPLLTTVLSEETFRNVLKSWTAVVATPIEIDAARRQRERILIAALEARMAADKKAKANAELRWYLLNPNSKV
jgi:hypothetical protein